MSLLTFITTLSGTPSDKPMIGDWILLKTANASPQGPGARPSSVQSLSKVSYTAGDHEPRVTSMINHVLSKGDTLSGVLADAGVPLGETYDAIGAIKSVFDPREIRAGQKLHLKLSRESKTAKTAHLQQLTLIYEIDQSISLSHLESEQFVAQRQSIEHDRQLVSTSGAITTSFYDAAINLGVPRTILLQVGYTLGSSVDFQQDIRRDDTFTLVYEVFVDRLEGGRHPGNLVSVSLELGDRTLAISRYTTDDGYTGFFDIEGRSIETSLLKTPLEGGRISSLFGKRIHPILGDLRKHMGIDIAAPGGTPVFAAGDGVVLQRRQISGLGNFIKVRHDKIYTTTYAHLSRYASGIEPGTQVRQGEVIGYVGKTGMASGPNLHYEIHANEQAVDPLTLNLPPRRVLSLDELMLFRQRVARSSAALEVVDPTGARAFTIDIATREPGNG